MLVSRANWIRVDIWLNRMRTGVMAIPESRTADGFETQFGTNHLAHFLLFQLLKPLLLSSSTPAFNSRVIALSSSGHRASGVMFDDYNFEKAGYNKFLAYGQSKTSNIYMANEIDRRYSSKGLHAFSVHPGGAMTGLHTHLDDVMKEYMRTNQEVINHMKSPAQGAATTVWAALSTDLEGSGGKFLEDCSIAKPVQGPGILALGYAPHAYNEEGEKKLWADSLKMLNIEDDD